MESAGGGIDLTQSSALLQERTDRTGAWHCWDFCQCGHRGMASKEAVQDLADVGELSSHATELLRELINLLHVSG